MKTITIGIAVLTLAVLTAAAHASTYSIPPLPDFPECPWEVGSAVTYRLQVAQGEDAAQCRFRIAILGAEHEVASDTTLYWVEFDFTEITGLPEDLEEYLLFNYGEAPTAIRMNMLIPRYDLALVITDPSRVYHDFTDPGFVRKLYFQYNRQTPYDVDTLLFGGFILPIVASQLMEGDLPEDFYDERNLGINVIEDPDAFTTEVSEGETTTEAGAFEGRLLSFTSSDENGPSGLLFYSADIPIISFVTFLGDWMQEFRAGHADAELISVDTSGAATEIVGEPVVFDLLTLYSYGTE